MRYTYGTSDAAARRLENIAGFFNPHSRSFVLEHMGAGASSVLDLGCGPGFTTEMLAGVLPDATVVGLDKSADFLQTARERRPDLRFIEHDVTATPFPIAADLAYARFLLSHLTDVVALVDQWADALTPGGVLLVEEFEGVETDVPVFERYLEIGAAMTRAQGADLAVGQTLAGGTYDHTVLCNRMDRLPVPNALAAGWFHPNTVTVWQEDAYVLENVDAAERDRISDELARIRGGGAGQGQTTWHMRRLALASADKA